MNHQVNQIEIATHGPRGGWWGAPHTGNLPNRKGCTYALTGCEETASARDRLFATAVAHLDFFVRRICWARSSWAGIHPGSGEGVAKEVSTVSWVVRCREPEGWAVVAEQFRNSHGVGLGPSSPSPSLSRSDRPRRLPISLAATDPLPFSWPIRSSPLSAFLLRELRRAHIRGRTTDGAAFLAG